MQKGILQPVASAPRQFLPLLIPGLKTYDVKSAVWNSSLHIFVRQPELSTSCKTCGARSPWPTHNLLASKLTFPNYIKFVDRRISRVCKSEVYGRDHIGCMHANHILFFLPHIQFSFIRSHQSRPNLSQFQSLEIRRSTFADWQILGLQNCKKVSVGIVFLTIDTSFDRFYTRLLLRKMKRYWSNSSASSLDRNVARRTNLPSCFDSAKVLDI